MIETIKFLEKLLPKEARKLNQALEAVNTEMTIIMQELNTKINDAYENRDFVNLMDYTKCAEMLTPYESNILKIMQKEENIKNDIEENYVQNPNVVKDIKNDISENKTECIEYTIEDNIHHNSLKGFKFLTEKIVLVESWQDLLIQTCEILIDIDTEKMSSIITMDFMNGEKINYLSKESKDFKKPIQLDDGIFLDGNLTWVQIKDLIINMLREYKFNPDDYKIYSN